MKYTHVSSAIVMEDAQEDASRIPPPPMILETRAKFQNLLFNKY